MMRWALTALALLLLLRLVLRFVLGLLHGLAVPSPGSASGRAADGGRAKIAGELVRDPVCSTYIPRASAIAVQAGGETRYYCSTTCRDKDADAGRAPRMGRAAHG
jgi:YHS domain-containing protein